MKLASITLPLLLALAACGPMSRFSRTKEAWDATNDPLRLSGDYDRTLADLPLSGALPVAPWSDTYWPSYKAGIARRWRVEGDPFTSQAPTLEALLAMSLPERARLSPAEKFDALIGRFDYPLVQRERARTSPDSPTWVGICHGWAPAALNFNEPHPVLATSINGLQIPFGSSDVKALLSYYQGEIARAPTYVLGNRCNLDLTINPEAASTLACRDTNAGAFHVVITNQIGLRGLGFIADVTRDAQVWNQPIHGFSSRLITLQAPSAGAAEGTTQEAVFETTMTYAAEIDPLWDAANGTVKRADAAKVYSYRVELNTSGQVIGGEWLTDDRPDFLWTQARPEFTGYFAPLAELYNLSQSGPVQPEI